MIELEVSDLGALESEGPARRRSSTCSRSGVHFAVDDVGTASVAISRIGSVPISTLKLDSSFVQLLGDDEETAALVGAIVGTHLATRDPVRGRRRRDPAAGSGAARSRGATSARDSCSAPRSCPGDVEQMLWPGSWITIRRARTIRGQRALPSNEPPVGPVWDRGRS